MTAIIGISAFYHDSAAAIIIDGDIIAAAQEERFTRVKNDASFPLQALSFVLKQANIQLCNIDFVVFYEKPFLKFERLIETYLAFCPRGFTSFRKALPVWLNEKLFLKRNILQYLQRISPEFKKDRLLFSEHHLSHAASAFYPSPFEEALVITLDGVGEWNTTTISVGKKETLEIIKEIKFPHSLGLLYSAFTYYTGFKVNRGEYKMMGLAPYGNPKFKNVILENLIDLKNDGSFRLDMNYFNFATGLSMISDNFCVLFGNPPRQPETPITQFYMDIAASIQKVIEAAFIKMTSFFSSQLNLKNLCLSGGVALNCVANGKIVNKKIFNNIWIPPAVDDAGGALGAALAVWHLHLKKTRSIFYDKMQGGSLGPSYSQKKVESLLNQNGAVFKRMQTSQFIEQIVQALLDGLVVGLFQGRMEFGSRALGFRSILADPRRPEMQNKLNIKIKFRESFRPFAPSILEEDANQYFDLNLKSSPYMSFVTNINPRIKKKITEEENNFSGFEKLKIQRSTIPVVTHVDYSARIQTVTMNTNPLFYKILKQFKKKTKCSVLANTSFNVREEPIVCNPIDAFECFMKTDMDILAIEKCFLEKSNQKQALVEKYRNMRRG